MGTIFFILQKGNGNPKRFDSLPKVTVIISDRARIQTQALGSNFGSDFEGNHILSKEAEEMLMREQAWFLRTDLGRNRL